MSKKRKKMLLMLPVIAIPFITMAFVALGGGKSKKKEEVTKGLNLELPDANLKDDKHLDKLSFYDQADKDSLKREEWMRTDPYFQKDTVTPGEIEQFTINNPYGQRLNTSLYEKQGEGPEKQLTRKLEQLQEQLNRPVEKPVVQKEQETDEPAYPLSQEDPDIKNLTGALDKILDIQHPDRVKERSRKNKGAVYAVRNENAPDTLANGFYSYSDENEGQQEEENAIEATIAVNQVLVNGSVVKFRISTEIFVAGKKIPANTLVSGIAALEGERLTVEINSIRNGKSLYGVKLEVYDMDGLPGIYVPGTINRDVAKESLNNSLSLADMTSLDPSFKAQAAATGIGAVKSLISKKAKLVRVQVKAGYKVLFKNKNLDQ